MHGRRPRTRLDEFGKPRTIGGARHGLEAAKTPAKYRRALVVKQTGHWSRICSQLSGNFPILIVTAIKVRTHIVCMQTAAASVLGDFVRSRTYRGFIWTPLGEWGTSIPQSRGLTAPKMKISAGAGTVEKTSYRVVLATPGHAVGWRH